MQYGVPLRCDFYERVTARFEVGGDLTIGALGRVLHELFAQIAGRPTGQVRHVQLGREHLFEP
jgi:hypothetical protein